MWFESSLVFPDSDGHSQESVNLQACPRGEAPKKRLHGGFLKDVLKSKLLDAGEVQPRVRCLGKCWYLQVGVGCPFVLRFHELVSPLNSQLLRQSCYVLPVAHVKHVKPHRLWQNLPCCPPSALSVLTFQVFCSGKLAGLVPKAELLLVHATSSAMTESK